GVTSIHTSGPKNRPPVANLLSLHNCGMENFRRHSLVVTSFSDVSALECSIPSLISQPCIVASIKAIVFIVSSSLHLSLLSPYTSASEISPTYLSSQSNQECSSHSLSSAS